MIPIYEAGSGRGVGHTFSSFRERFDQICQDHLTQKRAQAFAFIFYDFTDSDLRKILNDIGVFAQLDRLSGTRLSIFYLHSGTRSTVQAFNSHFLTALGFDKPVELPCVVFFKLNEDKVEELNVAELNSADLIHGFHELHSVVEQYLQNEENVHQEGRALRLVKSGGRFIGIEAFRAALRRGLDFF